MYTVNGLFMAYFRKEKFMKMKVQIPSAITDKDGELTQEIKDYIHKWVKENSDEINEAILKKDIRF